MKLYLKNTLQGLIPLYPADHEEKKRLKVGEEYEAEIRRPRNYLFHKKFFALVNVGWNNTQLDMPFETYRRYVTMKAGYFKIYKTPKGELVEPESIGFASMDQSTFEELYSRVLDVIIDDIGVSGDDIESEILNFF